jgi:penicillin amidase
MGHAADAAMFRDALRLFDSPQQNIVFADVHGTIGFVAAGRVPVRKALSGGGQMPAKGWTGENDWTGFIPFEALPQSLDPPSGRIVTANNDITPPGYDGFIAARWDAPFRAQRIVELLDAARGAPLTAALTGAQQMDDLSIPARNLLPTLLAGLSGSLSNEAAAAVEMLRGWDFRMDRDQAAPLIFTAWVQTLDRQLFAEELGPLYEDFFFWSGNGAGTLLNDTTGGDWCALAAPTLRPRCADLLASALETAVQALSEAYGDDAAGWRWGAAHQAHLAHPLLDRIPVLRDLAAVAVETDGDNFTVNRGTALPEPGLRYDHVHGASLRAVFDLADLDRSLFVLPGGQSGNLLSPHFADLVERWRDGGFVTIVGEGEARLTLAPTAE